jgi:hypothetical protein
MLAFKTWKTLTSKPDLDGGGTYNIVDPRAMHLGKSYSEYAADWLNWFLSANADKRNSGPVVFLRSHGLPNSTARSYDIELDTTITTPTSDTSARCDDYPGTYLNYPNIRIGSDKLQIFDDQAVFVPIITAYHFATVFPYRDWGNLQDYTGSVIDNGDNPPDPHQLTINNQPIDLPEELPMSEFRITTPIFTTVVPDVPYGISIKDFLEDSPIPPGVYPAMVAGYFVMLTFTKGSYWVHSWASAGREVAGPYFSELLYQIDVRERPKCVPHGMITVRRPAVNQGLANRALRKMTEHGQLTDTEAKTFRSIQEDVNKFLKQGPA